jgi:hypothetical protein
MGRSTRTCVGRARRLEKRGDVAPAKRVFGVFTAGEEMVDFAFGRRPIGAWGVAGIIVRKRAFTLSLPAHVKLALFVSSTSFYAPKYRKDLLQSILRDDLIRVRDDRLAISR